MGYGNASGKPQFCLESAYTSSLLRKYVETAICLGEDALDSNAEWCSMCWSICEDRGFPALITGNFDEPRFS